ILASPTLRSPRIAHHLAMIAYRFSARARRLARHRGHVVTVGKNRFAVVKLVIAAWRDSRLGRLSLGCWRRREIDMARRFPPARLTYLTSQSAVAPAKAQQTQGPAKLLFDVDDLIPSFAISQKRNHDDPRPSRYSGQRFAELIPPAFA